jgi:hypothetical protein
MASESLTMARVQARRSAFWESRLTWTSLGRATGGGIHFRTAVMRDRQRVLQLQNMSCSMRSGERIGMRETTKIDAGRGENSVG